MPGGGTRSFREAAQYEAALRKADIAAVIVHCGKFSARFTWAELHNLQVMRCEEDVPRLAYLQFGERLVFITFAARRGQTALWRGTELQAGSIIFHSPGERLHHSIAGSFVWGVIAADPAQLDYYGHALSGKPLSAPLDGRMLKPSHRDLARLRRLHAQTCRLAETKPRLLALSEVARAIEQDLLQTLVTCLTTSTARTGGSVACDHGEILVRFEEILTENLCGQPSMRDVCKLIGVSGRTLWSCCAEFLGMSPARYILLRRLRLVRNALRDPDRGAVSAEEIVHRFGFVGLASFARSYRAAFGETPSATLRGNPAARSASR